MGILDKVMGLKEKGLNETQIMKSLREEGIQPKEITNAISQSKIKDMLNKEQGLSNIPEPMTPENETTQEDYGLQPSIMPSEENEENTNPDTMEVYEDYSPNSGMKSIPATYSRSTKSYDETGSEDNSEELTPPSPTEDSPSYNEGEDYTDYYQEYSPPQSVDLETINDIAEQIIEEKLGKMKKQVSTLSATKEDFLDNIKKLDERLTKIEKNFADLQLAILGRIGDYSKDLKNLTKEVHSTQESFTKVLDPLAENINELKKVTESIKDKTRTHFEEKEDDSVEKDTKESSETTSLSDEEPINEGFKNYLR